jgi:hypothetical protein
MGSTPIPGSNGQTHVTPLNSTAKERVFKTLWSMKNDGYGETTIYATNRRLRMIAPHLGADIDNPEKVKGCIAEEAATNGYKKDLAYINLQKTKIED